MDASSSSAIDWQKVKAAFPSALKHVFLNAAGGSPIPIPVADAGRKYYTESVDDGEIHWDSWIQREEQTRSSVARLINAKHASEIGFTLNTSHGMSLVANMLHKKGKRGRVLTFRDEFPSSTYPWLNLNYELHFVEPGPNGVYSLESVRERIREVKPEILVSSYVQYRTGFRQDINELGKLAREHSLAYVVNTTQCMGVIPVDVQACQADFLVCSCFKWTVAGYGCGVIYMNEKWLSSQPKCQPMLGWRSVKDPMVMDNLHPDIKEEASGVEVGCPQFPSIFALGAAVEFLQGIGVQNIYTRILELGDYLLQQLQSVRGVQVLSPVSNKAHRSGIHQIKLPAGKDAQEVVSKLKEKNVMVSQRGGDLRVSVHIYNDKNDIDALISTLKSVLQ